MLLIPSNWRDIQKYYQGTFVKFKEHGDMLFRIVHVSDKAVTGTYNGGTEEFVLTLDEYAPYELDYILPNKAMFQHKQAAYLLYRIPYKQYSRGITSENTAIVSPFNGDAQPVSWNLLRAYVEKPQYRTLKEALQSSGASSALNSRMAISHSTCRIYLDTTPIATVVDRKNLVVETVDVYQENIQKLLPPGEGFVRVVG